MKTLRLVLWIAAALVAPVTRPLGLLAGAGLLALYAGAMAINIRRGRTHVECGCGGPVQPINGATLLRNGIGTLRANLGMAAFSYPSGVLAWSAGGTFAAGKAALAASLSAHHTYATTGLGTALAQAIRTKINI